jgi:hypothetical protein
MLLLIGKAAYTKNTDLFLSLLNKINIANYSISINRYGKSRALEIS